MDAYLDGRPNGVTLLLLLVAAALVFIAWRIR